MPGTTVFITKNIEMEPFSEDLPGDPFGITDGGEYDPLYRATINYEATRESCDERQITDPVTYLERSINAGGQFLAVPPNKTFVGDALDDNRDQQIPILKMVPTAEYTLRFPLVVNPNFAVLTNFLGRVNSVAHPFLFNAAPETCLYSRFSATQKFVWNGARGCVQPWDLEFGFSHRIVDGVAGWNHVFSPNRGTWIRVFTANREPLYQSFNPIQLFS